MVWYLYETLYIYAALSRTIGFVLVEHRPPLTKYIFLVKAYFH